MIVNAVQGRLLALVLLALSSSACVASRNTSALASNGASGRETGLLPERWRRDRGTGTTGHRKWDVPRQLREPITAALPEPAVKGTLETSEQLIGLLFEAADVRDALDRCGVELDTLIGRGPALRRALAMRVLGGVRLELFDMSGDCFETVELVLRYLDGGGTAAWEAGLVRRVMEQLDLPRAHDRIASCRVLIVTSRPELFPELHPTERATVASGVTHLLGELSRSELAAIDGFVEVGVVLEP